MTRLTTWTLVLLFCAAVLTLASSALAADGLVPINQNTSTSGLPGCPHAGFPIIICQPGSYHLTGNLTIPDANTDGIDITSDDVTLGLDGFTIAGPVTCTLASYPLACSAGGNGIGINAPNTVRNVAIRNGTIRGMGNGGIKFGAGYGVLLQEVHVDNIGPGPCTQGVNPLACGVGINFSHGSGVVTSSTVQTCAGDGIVGGDQSLTISSSTITYNGGDGIADAGAVSHCIASFNGQSGINNAWNVKNSTMYANKGYGLFGVTGYGGNVIAFNGFGAVSAGSTSVGGNLCDGSSC